MSVCVCVYASSQFRDGIISEDVRARSHTDTVATYCIKGLHSMYPNNIFLHDFFFEVSSLFALSIKYSAYFFFRSTVTMIVMWEEKKLKPCSSKWKQFPIVLGIMFEVLFDSLLNHSIFVAIVDGDSFRKISFGVLLFSRWILLRLHNTYNYNCIQTTCHTC